MFLVVDNCEDGSRKHFLTSEFFKEHCVYCNLKTLREAYDKDVHKYIIDITSDKESSLYILIISSKNFKYSSGILVTSALLVFITFAL